MPVNVFNYRNARPTINVVFVLLHFLSYIYTSNVSYCYCVTIELLLFHNSIYEDINVRCPRLCTRHIGYVFLRIFSIILDEKIYSFT